MIGEYACGYEGRGKPMTHTQRIDAVTVTITGNPNDPQYRRLVALMRGLADGDVYEMARAASGICAATGKLEDWKG